MLQQSSRYVLQCCIGVADQEYLTQIERLLKLCEERLLVCEGMHDCVWISHREPATRLTLRVDAQAGAQRAAFLCHRSIVLGK